MSGRRKFWRRPFVTCASVFAMSEAATKPVEVPDDGDMDLVVRAASLCNPFLDGLGEVTLLVRGSLVTSVMNWNESLYQRFLLAALRDVQIHAAAGGSFEIAAVDCRLDAELRGSAGSRSRDAGKRLVSGLLAPRGDRMIELYRCAVLAGDSPGHLAVIHALRASVFHLSPGITAASYLLQEGTGAGLNGREITRYLIAPLSASAICGGSFSVEGVAAGS